MLKIESLFLLYILFPFGLLAQVNDYASTSSVVSTYNPIEAFSPIFYTHNGTVYRSASGKPGPQYWQNQSDYSINARLDESKHRLFAKVIITYTNNSPDDLEFLWLQLEQNLFRSDSRGTAMNPVRGGRSGIKDQQYDAGFSISSVSLIDGGQRQLVAPLINDTRMQLPLNNPLKAKGGVIQVEINYSYIIPNYGSDRTGILQTSYGEIFAVAQWYPRMCVYDDILGWNTTPYTGLSEFYLDYGNFDVRIDVPATHMLVASGDLQNAEEVFSPTELKRWNQSAIDEKTSFIRTPSEVKHAAGTLKKERKVWHYKMANTRDLTWASSAAFVVDAAKMNIDDNKTGRAISAYPVESATADGWLRSTEYLKASIEYYSAKLYPYPYSTAVNVATNLAGMEYPGLSFCNWKDSEGMLWNVTDHEAGHNWFPMIVGSNERFHGWMDEGLNSFINYLSSEKFNNGEYKEDRLDLHKWARILADDNIEPITTYHDNVKEDNIPLVLYTKPAIGLGLLRDQLLGKERFDNALKTYIARWAFKHPTPEDFFRTIENVAGEDLSWFWRGWFINNWRVDIGITDVKYKTNDPVDGIYITLKCLQKMPMPAIVEITTQSGNKIRKKLPVDIWRHGNTWTFYYPTSERVLSVLLDPDHALPDCNQNNDYWKMENL